MRVKITSTIFHNLTNKKITLTPNMYLNSRHFDTPCSEDSKLLVY